LYAIIFKNNVFLLALETRASYGKLQALLFWLDEIAGYPPPKQ
jgi:hypothetical protein